MPELPVLARVDFRPLQLEHLNLHPLGKRAILGRRAFTPDENSGIPSGFHVTPFYVQNKILILLF